MCVYVCVDDEAAADVEGALFESLVAVDERALEWTRMREGSLWGFCSVYTNSQCVGSFTRMVGLASGSLIVIALVLG